MAPAALAEYAPTTNEIMDVQELVRIPDVSQIAGMMVMKTEVGDDTVIRLARDNFTPPALTVAVETTPGDLPAEMAVYAGPENLDNRGLILDGIHAAVTIAGKQKAHTAAEATNLGDANISCLHPEEDGGFTVETVVNAVDQSLEVDEATLKAIAMGI